jgi:hypothetical protein
MKMQSRVAAAWILLCGIGLAQDMTSGVAVPVTVSGGWLYSHRLQGEDPNNSPANGGVRVTLYPSLKLSDRFFAYAAIQVRSTPYFYYDAYEPERQVTSSVLQGFAGYTATFGASTLVIKGGKLSSAFGSFPLRYDDTDNPLLDQPLAYVTHIRLRPDQLPCGVSDLLHQGEYHLYVEHYCGGSERIREGVEPVTLYGIPGAQADFSSGPVDLRLQLTNSSPANPQGLSSPNQHLQWTAGGGYTYQRQLRVGGSIFRGPYLERDIQHKLPAGRRLRDYPATGTGVDLQWSRGRWSTNGEWHRFQLMSPRFVRHPTVQTGYVEVKTTLTPRWYVASRIGWYRFGRVADLKGEAAPSFGSGMDAYEVAFGYHLSRHQRLKVGYEWLRTQGVGGTRDNVFGVQLVTTLRSLSKAW